MTAAAITLGRRPFLRRPEWLALLSPAAWLYWSLVVVPSALGIPFAATHVHASSLGRFAVVAVLASASQLLSFHLNKSRVFHTGIAFTVAAALLLPPELIILVCVCQHLPEWVKQRYPWYIQTFNIANYVVAGIAAWTAAHAVGFPASGSREAVAGALAAGVFVVTNRLLLIPMLYLGRGLTPRQTGLLGVEDVSLELVLSLMAVPLAVFWNHSLPLAALSLAPLFVVHFTQRAMLGLEKASDEIEDAHREVMKRSTATLEALARTVDARDKYTAGHSKRVAAISTAIAGELGLSGAELESVGQAALLHDIGKIGLPDSILLKPGPLSQSEELAMRRHPEDGARIIEPLGYLDDVVPAIRHHHERPDGHGYPGGLIGGEIPLAARIIHVADALDAMTTERLYRAALSFEAAMDEIRRGRGTDFCETCVDALERVAAAGGLGRLAPHVRAVA